MEMKTLAAIHALAGFSAGMGIGMLKVIGNPALTKTNASIYISIGFIVLVFTTYSIMKNKKLKGGKTK